ncbi:MAG TPA: SpoIIE family protein phosphatase [Bryobacteraceae bacterium]|nr:SpoIIE family protein phosphatase [Bryobacteraceae bacterium]
MKVEPGRQRILVADDQPDVLEALRLLLKGAGYASVQVSSPQDVLNAASGGPFDLILMDLNYARDTTSGAEGLDLLSRLERLSRVPPVVVMTAWGSVDLAVEAMQRGACDFVQKPWDNERLLSVIAKQLEPARPGRVARSELELARHVQQQLFPLSKRRLATIDYFGHCVPAQEVGGDYYDFLDSGAGGLAFVLGDVSGKGIASALLMANLQACFRSQPREALRQPAAALRTINRLFYESTSPEHFATVFLGSYDESTRRLRYANCGHPAPILLRREGLTERLAPTAIVLGAFANWACAEREVAFEPGDTLVLFSDGVTEAGADSPREFGDDGLLSAIQANRTRGAEAMVNGILGAVAAQTEDDATVVVIRSVPH